MSRLFCITDFQLDKTFWEKFYEDNEKVKYIHAGAEVCKSTERKHWQMFVYYESPKRITKPFIKAFGGRHIEAAKGSVADNLLYCNKESFAWSLGTLPNQGRRVDLEGIKENILRGDSEVDIATNHFSQWCVYRRSFDAYRSLVEPKRNWITEVIILWGAPGVGKSRTAYTDGAVPITYHNGAIGGYNGEDVVVFDDFTPSIISLQEVLKLTDRYPLNIAIKGGFRNWKPKKIYFTSNLNPTSWWGHSDAFFRRVSNVTEVVLGNTGPGPCFLADANAGREAPI